MTRASRDGLAALLSLAYAGSSGPELPRSAKGFCDVSDTGLGGNKCDVL